MELPEVGDYCSFSGCGALDFLPHKCPYCVKNFCTKHRLPEEHQCASTAAAAAAATTATTNSSSSTSATKIEASSKTVASSRLHVVTREEAIANGRTNRAVSAATRGCCGVCGSTVAPLITCDACGMVNCALHRLAERHDCIALAKVASEQTARKEKLARVEEAAAAAKERAEAYVRKKLAKAQAKAQRRKKKEMAMMMKEAGDGDGGGDGGVGGVGDVGDVGGAASGCSSSSAEIILMRLKHSATGKKSVPIEKRYHALVVHHEAETNRIRAKALWFSRKWSVGKVLDVAAEALKVTNNNNNINASHGGGGENCASYGNRGNDDPTTPTTTATATTITTTTTKRLSLFRASDAKQLDDTKIKISEAIEDGATIVLTTLASISTCDERYALY